MVFIEFNFLFYLIFSRHKRQQNPAPAHPASPSPPPPAPRRRRKPQNPWVLPWILQREERGCYRTLLDELITTDVPDYGNFTRMEPAFFYLIEERITPHLRKSFTNFRKPLEVGMKLAVTLTAPLHISTLFPDEALRQAEQDIASFESKGQHQPGKKGRFHPYDRPDKRGDNRKQERPAWKNIGQRGQGKKARGKASYYSSRPAKGQQSYK